MTSELPEYENPPVREVVCGILFESLEGLLAPHLGLLWERFRDEYPTCKHMPPLAAVVERFGEPPKEQMQLVDIPPLPRVWFVNREGNGIIQVQQDRFLHNWKKVSDDDAYPRYDAVIGMFKRHLDTFLSFLKEQSIGEVSPVQYEMTYVNEIRRHEGWDSKEQIGRVFPDLSWRASRSRFLSDLESVNCRFTFQMPERSGRLHVAVRTTERRDGGEEVMLLELTARGIGEQRSHDAMWDWYRLAREWIVRSFADLTSSKVQDDTWGRRR